jgi:hypothetical protein
MPRISCPARPPWWKSLPRRPTPSRNQGPLAALAAKAVTGAVTAVTRGRGPALTVTGTLPAVIAVAGGLPRSFRA